MRARHRLKVILGLLFVAAVLLLGISGPYHRPDASVRPLFGETKVRLSSGEYPQDSSSLTAVVSTGDVQALGLFPKLSQADFSGSSCYDEIIAWGEANPDVQLRYTVTLPDGTVVDNSCSSVDISGYSPSLIQAAAKAIGYLPQVQTVSLGTLETDEGLSLADLAFLREALPEMDFDFNFELLGRSITPQATAVDLKGLKADQVEDAAVVLSALKQLNTIVLDDDTELSVEELNKLAEAAPLAALDMKTSVYGKELNLADDAVDLSHVKIEDKGEQLRRLLPLMRNCKLVDMDYCGVSNEDMAKIRDENPDKEVVWRIWFGENYSVRTDVERILASKPTVGGMIIDGSPLQYCTKVKYLDLGHNTDLADISFVASMPDLEVFIVAMTAVTDISPLENCPKLEYLEIQTNEITDLSPLKGLTELAHLNICELPELTDVSPLYGLSKLERLWIGNSTPIPEEQLDQLKKALPNCNINTKTGDPHGDSWRFSRYDPEIPKYYWVPRHELLREQMGYNYQEYSFYWLDPKCGDPAPAEFAGKYGKEVYGLD